MTVARSVRRTVYAVSITPFTSEGALDETGLRSHVGRLAAAGVWTYVGGSGTGEANSLSGSELRRIYELAVDEIRGSVPTRAAGIEARTAAQVLAQAALARDVGLDALQVYGVDMGHAIRPSNDELERYFTDVLDAVRMPVVLTSHQYLGYLVPLDMIERLLSRYGEIVGVICNTTDFAYLVRLLEMCAGRCAVHLGRPELGLSALDLGATGFGLAEANVVPVACAEALRAYDRGDLPEAHRRFAAILRLYSINLSYGNVRGIKEELRLLGLPGGGPRPPRLPLTPGESAVMAAALDSLRKEFSDDLSVR